MWYSQYEHLDKVKCKKHPKYKVMRQPRVACPDCWSAWLSRNLNIILVGKEKDFVIKSLQTFAKQEAAKVTEYVKERSIDDIIDDDPYADIIRGS